MHSYDAEGRPRITAFLAVCSILVVWLLHAGLGAVDYQPRWWFSVPSFAGVFSVVYWAFDRWVWRINLLRKSGIVPIPNLNGRWDGTAWSSYDPSGEGYAVSLVILQRWTRMVITLETETSQSRSITASLKLADEPNPTLSYLYRNEPKATAPETMNIHHGTTVVELKGSVLEGRYYTGRGRVTYGTVKLTRA